MCVCMCEQWVGSDVLYNDKHTYIKSYIYIYIYIYTSIFKKSYGQEIEDNRKIPR